MESKMAGRAERRLGLITGSHGAGDRIQYLICLVCKEQLYTACQPVDPCILCYFKYKSQRHRIGKIEKGAWKPFCGHLWQGSCHVRFVDIIIQWPAIPKFND
jgi:hypothetical protein